MEFVAFGVSIAVTDEHIVVSAGQDYAGGLPWVLRSTIAGSVLPGRKSKAQARNRAQRHRLWILCRGQRGNGNRGAPGDDTACPQDPGCNSGSAYVFELARAPLNSGPREQRTLQQHR